MCWNTEHFDSLSFGIRSSGFWILVYNVYNINFGFMCFNFPIKYRLNTDIAGINNKGECYFVNVLYDSVCLTYFSMTINKSILLLLFTFIPRCLRDT